MNDSAAGLLIVEGTRYGVRGTEYVVRSTWYGRSQAAERSYERRVAALDRGYCVPCTRTPCRYLVRVGAEPDALRRAPRPHRVLAPRRCRAPRAARRARERARSRRARDHRPRRARRDRP